MIRDKKIIGRSTKITIVDAGIKNLPAKVDTGAYSSAVWTTGISEKDGVLHFTLLGPSSPHYNGKKMSTKRFKKVLVQNSFGHIEERYVVRLKIILDGHTFKARFTLANRHEKSYSALIGRRLLRNRYIVDVTRGGLHRKKTEWR